MRALLSAPILNMISRHVPTKARVVLVQVKETPGRSLGINTASTFWNMEIAVELNWLLVKFLLLCQVDIQKSSPEDNAKFNFLGIIWESKNTPTAYFSGFRGPNIHIVSSCNSYVLKRFVLRYSEVGTYAVAFLWKLFWDISQKLYMKALLKHHQ